MGISKKTGLLFILALAYSCSYAQLTKRTSKLSPLLQLQASVADSAKMGMFLITVTNNLAFDQWLLQQKTGIKKIAAYQPANTFFVEAKWADVLKHLAGSSLVLFIDEKRLPKEELLVNGYDISTNKINKVHNQFPFINGQDVTVSVKENKIDTADIDFKGRFISTPFASPTVTGHASIMATMIAGAGNSYYQGKGAAWGSSITSSNFATLLPDADTLYRQFKIAVQNHSYGTGIENFYGTDAAAYDASAINNPSLLHIFSAGNSGTSASATGAYAGLAGYANLTGSFKMSKNSITVGATDSFGIVATASSKGPAYDGSVKPELVAFGEDGSSGAAAIVSGISLLLQQAYKEQHANALPPSALIKSILLNSADDVEKKGIDYTSGYGSVNAYKAMTTLQAGNYVTGNVIHAGTQTFNITVPASIKQLKLTLAWADPMATVNAAKALVNDLDVELQWGSQSWKPWVLNPFPHRDSLARLPMRQRDSLNNAEQITIDDPAAGNYTIQVTGFKVITPAQNFYISWQLDTADRFTWYYPTHADNISSGSSNTIRWASNFATATGQLEYSINGTAWQLINPAVDLTKGYYKWIAPDTFTTAILRMKIGQQVFLSDSCTISKRISTAVGFNCADSFLFYWPKVSGINSYRVFQLGNTYLQTLLTTTDTAVVISKSSNPSLHYAVAPVMGNTIGVKSFTFNYSTQGVACYVKTFLAQLVNSTAQLNLDIGSNYRIRTIQWQKLISGSYQTLQTISPVSGLQFTYTDAAITKGVNTYRAKIELDNGQVIYSSVEKVNYLADADYIVFPNPVFQSQTITILCKEADNATLQIFNSQGIKILEKKADDVLISFPANRLSKGVYFIRVMKNNEQQETIKFVVY